MDDKTDTLKRAMLVALEVTKGIVTSAASQVGIHRSTHYDWYNDDPEYKAAVDSINDVALDFVEGKLFERINGVQAVKGYTKDGEAIIYDVPPSDVAAIFYLKTKGKKRGFVERQELSGPDGGPVRVVPLELEIPKDT